MKRHSLGVNFIFNILKTLMGVIFPLITFPYVARILGPEYMGKIDYAQANITYFTLIAGFGISGYAVREGARIRDDKERLNRFSGEMLAVNLVTVSIAYILCFLSLLVPKFAPYRGLMLIFSSTIILSAIGLEWLYNVYEDYQYITVRSFVFQVISMILLFTCVKAEGDYVIYALILICSSVGSNIMNLFRSRKYIRLRVLFNKNFFSHIKPMFYIFIMNIAASIYLIMDRSMLGFLTGDDTEVGLYSAAIKITTVITSLMNTVRVVMTPRVSYFVQNDKKQAERLNYMAIKLVCMFSIPCAIGLFFLSDKVLLLFAGNKYLAATDTLKILLMDVVFAAINGVVINQIFISYRKDKKASMAVIIGAVTNLILNSFTIPLFGKEGAAISTVASEVAIFVFACIEGRDIFRIRKVMKQIVQSIFACIPMVGIYFLLGLNGVNDIVLVLSTIFGGALLYFVMLFIMKNELIKEGYSYIKEIYLNKKKAKV